ncbi:MAG: DNA-binding protein WhiA [Firmicutes bacterium]|nr:DNA-binding protein WhiA [Bacillota bacterium]MCL1954284.1 DNA-binding protein WhiA [Bacillota bacterium]
MNTIDIKQEIALNIIDNNCCKLSFCKGILDSCCYKVDNEFCIDTHNKYALLLKPILQIYNLKIFKLGQLLRIEGDNIDKFILDMDLLNISNSCCIATYLKGVYLGVGSFSMSTGYHLEFVLPTVEKALYVQYCLQSFNIVSKILAHHNRHLVYIKDSVLIADIMVLLGAINNSLEFNNVLASADIRKNINRATNCITANIDKSIYSSLKYIECIEWLQSSGNFDKLSPVLQDTAKIRLMYPEQSLELLAKSLKISKSGIKHRLDKIVDICNDLKKL